MPFKSKTDGQIRRRNRMQEGRPAETDRPSPSKRGYGWDWQKVRAAKLARNPLCERCEQRGKVVEATVVHHKERLRGDTAQVADGVDPFESLCEPCHARDKGDKGPGFKQRGKRIERKA